MTEFEFHWWRVPETNPPRECYECGTGLRCGRKVGMMPVASEDPDRRFIFCPGCLAGMTWLPDAIRDEALRLAAGNAKYRRTKYPDGAWTASAWTQTCKDCGTVVEEGDRVLVLKWLDPSLSGALCEECGTAEEMNRVGGRATQLLERA